MPSINAIHDELQGRGLTALLVNLGESPETVARTVRDGRNSAPILLDNDVKVADAYHVTALPTVVLVGRDGGILGRAVGPRRWGEQEGRALLEELLGRPGPRPLTRSTSRHP